MADSEEAVAYGTRLRDPAWLFGMAVGIALVTALAMGGYWGAWVFAGLLVLELVWPLTTRVIRRADDVVDDLRFIIEPFKRFPGGLVGVVGLIVGIVLGNLVPDAVQWLGTGVDTAIRGIARAAPFIIFFTLTPAIAGTIRAGGAGKFALHVNLAYVATTVVAGLFTIALLVPTLGVRLTGGGNVGVGDTVVGILQTTGNLAFTSAPFLAIWSAVGISLLMYGFGMRGIDAFTGFVGGKIIELLGDILKILLPLILLALGVFIPTNVGRAINTARAAGAIPQGTGFVSSLSPEAAYGFSVLVLVGFAAIWVFGAAYLVMRYTKFSFKAFLLNYFADVFPYAWASSSSAATIPINLERTGEGLEVRPTVREFIIPLGATINLDGTMIGGFVTTVIAAQMVGYTPTLVDLLTILVPLTIVTIGVPGIPGGIAILAGPIIAGLLPLPPGTVEIFIAIFIGFNLGLSDQFRTGVNSVDNGLMSRLFEHWYPKKYMRHLGDAIPAVKRPKIVS